MGSFFSLGKKVCIVNLGQEVKLVNFSQQILDGFEASENKVSLQTVNTYTLLKALNNKN